MNRKIFIRGNEAVVEAAIIAGCQCYFGYPITPQNELTAYMALRMRQEGRVFLQAESEVAAINMVFGAAAAGVRVMTSSSSPGISLKQEGISYLAGAELPAVIVNVARGGPGLGNIAPSQGDYFQATRGGGHGDYRTLVLAPYSVQEIVDLTILAFELADKYRNPVILLIDGMLGQMMETVIFKDKYDILHFEKPWALTGCKGRSPNVIKSMYLDENELYKRNLHLLEKYKKMEEEIRYELDFIENSDLTFIAFGISARIGKKAVKILRERGKRISFFRPITLFPFPYKVLSNLAEKTSAFFVFELNCGQMVEDVKLGVLGKREVFFFGSPGGLVPTPEDLVKKVEEVL